MKKVGIYQIVIPSNADTDGFEKHFQDMIFPTIGVGKQTRGGIVTRQYLLKSDNNDTEHRYSWVVHWLNQGGSPFGSDNAPKDPADKLSEFSAKTSYSGFTLKAEEG